MRAGPLSNPKVISLLNSSFVPVYTSNEDYTDKGRASAGEKKALRRIYEEALSKGFSTGTVHVYILAPDGKVLDTRHVAKACEKGEVESLLEGVAKRLLLKPGDPLAKPAPQSKPYNVARDSVVLHLTARGHGCSWDEFPSESWVVFTKEEWSKLLPPQNSRTNEPYELDKAVAKEIFRHFYPQTENNQAKAERIETVSLRATPLAPEAGQKNKSRRFRLDGHVRLKHAFYPGREDDRRVEATAVGYLDLETGSEGKTRLRRLRLVTTDARYGPGTLEVGVREVLEPEQELLGL